MYLLLFAVLLITALLADGGVAAISRNLIRRVRRKNRVRSIFGTPEERQKIRKLQAITQANRGDSREVIAIKERDIQIREYLSKIASIVRKLAIKTTSTSMEITEASAISVRYIHYKGGTNDGEEDNFHL